MSRRARSGVLAIVLSLGLPIQLAIAGHEPIFIDTGAPAAQPFIFNGEPVDNPGWVVSIVRNGSYTCAGALLNQQWVLTAAHCVDDFDQTFWVNVGADSWFQGIQRGITSVHIHPDYSETLNESVDLAMLRLDAPLNGTPLPVLAAMPTWPTVNQPLVVMGWGETSTGSPPPANLQGAGVLVGSDSTGAITSPNCPPEWVAASGFEDFCFGGSSWACRGDSGGPLVGYASPQHSSGSVNTIYGVTSYGDAAGCTEATLDTVAQSVGPHLSWINGFLGVAGSPDSNDEMFFYRDDGLYRYYNIKPNGSLGSPILAGTEYTTGWSSITAIDLDG
jgi:secreted trypsin-like serine protease